jgi:hypothetical protein
MPSIRGMAYSTANSSCPHAQERGGLSGNAAPPRHLTAASQCGWPSVPLSRSHHGRRQQPCDGVHCGAGEGAMCYDNLSRILRGVVHHAIVASMLEPPQRQLHGLEAEATATGEGFSQLGARGDVLVALEPGITVLDVSVTPPPPPPRVALCSACAATDGAAAARRDAENCRAYNELAPNGYPLVLFSVETYGHLGKPVGCICGHAVCRGGGSRRCEQIRLCCRSVTGA